VPDSKVSYADITKHIEEKLPNETPPLFGLHPNAEIGYLTHTQDYLFKSILGLGGGGTESISDDAGATALRSTLHGIMSRLPPAFNLFELDEKAKPLLEKEQGPYVVVALQECARMNKLTEVMKNSLSKLQKGLDGALNMTGPMEDLASALSTNEVPGRNPFHATSWEKYAWWSKKSLSSWFLDLLARIEQLQQWTSTLELPYSMWLSGLFNPSAFNTAVMQVTARKKGLPLDNMTTETHITTTMDPSKMTAHPENGAYIHGVFIEGARWAGAGPNADEDEAGEPWMVDNAECSGFLMDSHLKDLLPAMPVIYLKAVEVQNGWEPSSVGYLRNAHDVLETPVYITTFRGPTYLFLATLTSTESLSKWVLASVALILQSDD